MHLLDSVGKCPAVEYIVCSHEQACAFAAEAYAEYTNHLGAVLVTTGPGGTNTVTGMAAAWVESAPCLFISGQVKCSDLIGARGVRSMGPQELDVVSIVRPITKYAVTIMEPESIRYHLQKAVFLATHGRRGPVWMEIPLDIQASMVDENNLRGFTGNETEETPGKQDLGPLISQTIDLLNQSERPVVLVGNGVRSANAAREFIELTELLQAPILTTWKAMDFLPEEHLLYAGRPGAVGQRGANFTVQNADCLLIIGARLDLPQTGFNHQNFARAAKKIMVDIDATEIKKMQTFIDMPICADAGMFMKEFLRQKNRLQTKNRFGWLFRCKQWQLKYPVALPEYWDQPSGNVNPYVLIATLSEELSADDLIVPGSSGFSAEMFPQSFKVKRGQRILNAPSLGAMGTGLPGSIGACIASNRKRTICFNGEGGFQLNIQELETVKRLQLPIKFFILANGGYASIWTMQKNHFQGRLVGSNPASGLTIPNITKIAGAYGLAAEEIHNHEELRETIRSVLDLAGPVVCVVHVDPNTQLAPRATSFIRPDGVMISKPLEDLWPFLDRKEFRSNMLIPPLDD